MSLTRRGQHYSQSFARTGGALAVSALLLVALLTTLAATASAAPATKAVTYRGYTMRVPADWPVYRLTPRSRVCVRFNRHALYLGSPGPRQRCPPNPAGRTEAILAAPLRAAMATRQGGTGRALAPVTVAGAQPAGGSETRVTITAHGLRLTATWQRHPGVVRRALGVKLGQGGTVRAAQSAGTASTSGFRPQARSSAAPRCYI